MIGVDEGKFASIQWILQELLAHLDGMGSYGLLRFRRLLELDVRVPEASGCREDETKDTVISDGYTAEQDESKERGDDVLDLACD